MKTVELELKFFPVLQQDLNSLLSEKLKLVKKQAIYKLLNQIEKPTKNFTDLRLEFFKKHGEDKEGNGNFILSKDLSPALKKEIDELSNKKEKIKIIGLEWKDIENITSTYPYYVLMKILLK